MNYQEKKYIPLSFVTRTTSEGKFTNLLHIEIQEALTFALSRQTGVDTLRADIETFIDSLSKSIFYKYWGANGQAGNFVFSRPLPVETLTREGGIAFAQGAIGGLIKSWARRNLTRESFLAYLYASKEFEVGEKMEVDAHSLNNVETDVENRGTTTTTEKFNAMLTTSSTGTANKTETLDNRTDSQTTKGTTTSRNSVLRDYAGDIKAFKRSFMTDGAGDSIFEMLTLSAERDLFIPVEDLFPHEIIDEGDIKG